MAQDNTVAGIAAHLAGGAVLLAGNKGRLATQRGVAGARRRAGEPAEPRRDRSVRVMRRPPRGLVQVEHVASPGIGLPIGHS